MTVVELVDKHFQQIAFLLALVLCVPLVVWAGDPVMRLIKDLVAEFGALLRGIRSGGALNALGGLFIMAVAVLLFTSGPIELLTAGAAGPGAESTAIQAIRAFLILVLVAYFLVSIRITRN